MSGGKKTLSKRQKNSHHKPKDETKKNINKVMAVYKPQHNQRASSSGRIYDCHELEPVLLSSVGLVNSCF